MIKRACLTALLLSSACATSGTLSEKPLAIGTEWTTLAARPAIQGGRERFVLVESPEDGPVECDGGHGVVWRYHGAVTIEVEVLDSGGAWSKLRCSGYFLGSGTSRRNTLLFTLADHPGTYRAARIRSSETAVIPSVVWSRSHDV